MISQIHGSAKSLYMTVMKLYSFWNDCSSKNFIISDTTTHNDCKFRGETWTLPIGHH